MVENRRMLYHGDDALKPLSLAALWRSLYTCSIAHVYQGRSVRPTTDN
jgi:hypothetical protein